MTPTLRGQTKCIVMMTKERSTTIVTYITPGAGGSCGGAWSYKLYSENTLFLSKSSLLPGIDQTN